MSLLNPGKMAQLFVYRSLGFECKPGFETVLDVSFRLQSWISSQKTRTVTFKVYLKLGHCVSCFCTHQQVIHIKVTYWLNEWNGGRDNRIKTVMGRGLRKIRLLILEELVCESWGEKNHQFFKSVLSQCRHFEMISLRLLRAFLGSAVAINVFSRRHNWHILTFLL